MPLKATDSPGALLHPPSTGLRLSTPSPLWSTRVDSYHASIRAYSCLYLVCSLITRRTFRLLNDNHWRGFQSGLSMRFSFQQNGQDPKAVSRSKKPYLQWQNFKQYGLHKRWISSTSFMFRSPQIRLPDSTYNATSKPLEPQLRRSLRKESEEALDRRM